MGASDKDKASPVKTDKGVQTVEPPHASQKGTPFFLTILVGIVAASVYAVFAHRGEFGFVLQMANFLPSSLTHGTSPRALHTTLSSSSAGGSCAASSSSSGACMASTRHSTAPPIPKHNIAVPVATLINGSGVSDAESSEPFYRPRILTDSITPPVSPAHGPDKIGLFLYRNGFSESPVAALVTKERLCKSHDSIKSVLSNRVSDDFNCQGNCRVFLANGWEVSSCAELLDNDKLWLVQPGREFMWPTFERGHKVEVRHVETSNYDPIIVETLSQTPKLFHLHNFFSADEADTLIENALGISDPANKLKRSTTGQGDEAHQDTHRTSHNAWDMTSPTALRLKRRCFELLGIRPYEEAWADGLQILRYNLSQAYNSHLDYLEYKPNGRLDSANGGANRFATIVVYLTDVEEGGETAFPNAPSLDPNAPSQDTVLQELRGRGLSELGIKEGSWEERLVVQCRTRLAFRPKKAEAVLFYSQHPDGRQDENSLHGGCPVIRGVKWAANLWVWNGPVHGDDTAVASSSSSAAKSLIAQFTATVPGYSLYWQTTFFGQLHPGVPIRLNTFEGHQFNVVMGDEEEVGDKVATYTIAPDTGADQLFEFTGVVRN